MKRRIFTIPLFILTLVMSLCFAFAGCTPNGGEEKVTYTVTVTGGTGGGEYESGSECTVTAELGENQQFVRWEDATGKEVSTENPYKFEVVEDVALTAVTQTQQVTVTVTGGYITGTELTSTSVDIGSKVSVTAPDDQSRPFKYWQIDGQKQSSDNPYEFTANKDTSIVAVTDVVCLIKVSGGTVGDDGETSKKYNCGEQCTIKADAAPEGQKFVYWYILDEYGKEQIVSREEVYTFDVAESEKYYAKFGKVYTVNIEGGYVESESGNLSSINITEGGSCTVHLDFDKIPENKGFLNWDLGDGTTSAEMSFVISNIKRDMTISAVYGDLIKFATPEMDQNQMFRYKGDYRPLEFDRGTTSAFVEGTKHVMFYMYTSTWADKDDYVGRFILDANGHGGYRLATVDGETLIELEGSAGNLWVETKNDYTRDDLFAAFAKVLGEKYSSTTPYYLAAQTCGEEGSVYATGDISVIGPAVFIEKTVATHTVNVKGGVITGTELTSVTAYEGQTVSITATSDDFLYWLVNGSEQVEEKTYEFVVEGDTQLVAVSGEMYTISVVGGTVDGETEISLPDGSECTLVADQAPQNQQFAYWYTLGQEGKEIKVSENAEYTFHVSGNETYYAKFINTYTITVVGGYVDGVEGEGGVYTVLEGGNYTILPQIPEDKGFVEWRVGGEKVSDSQKYVVENISGDLSIEAVFDELVYIFDTPEMNTNQMFDIEKGNYSTIILDRMKVDGNPENPAQENRKTAFVEHVDHVMFYIYTTPYADKDSYVGRFIMDMNGTGAEGPFRLATVDGEILLNLKGKAGDVYLDFYSRERLFADVFSKVVGDYNSKTPYYLAAQVCGVDGSIYAPSEISVIGPRAFIAQDIPAYTVTIEGGVVTGTELTTVTVYEGQKVSVTATEGAFKYWNINGKDKLTDKTIEIAITSDTAISAGTEQTFTVKTEGGTISGEGTEKNISSGEECTIIADEPEEGYIFVCWYVLGADEQKIVVSNEAEYTFWVFGTHTYYAEYAESSNLTIMFGDQLKSEAVYAKGQTVSVSIDPSDIPEGKGFAGWKIGEEIVSTDRTYEFVLSGDTVITAVFEDQQKLAAPEMDKNQMFRYNGDYKPLEFDRGSSTAFVEGVDHITFYIYTSPDAAKDDYVGTFILDANGSGSSVFRLATSEGETLLALEGTAGNLWLDTRDGYTKEKLFEMFAKVIGESYSADQGYYLAAQACGEEGSVYASSDISDIGSLEFKQN